MRVLLVTQGLPPASLGGVERYSWGLAQALRAGGDTVTVLASESDPAGAASRLRREERDGVQLVWLNRAGHRPGDFASSYRSPLPDSAWLQLVDELRPELVHVQHVAHVGVDLIGALDAAGVPVIVTLHDYWPLCLRGQLLDVALRPCPGPSPGGCARCLTGAGAAVGAPAQAARGLGEVVQALPDVAKTAVLDAARWTLRRLPQARSAEAAARARLAATRAACSRARWVVAPSITMLERARAWGLPSDRLRHLPYGHDTAGFEASAPQAGPLRLGFVGSLIVSKGPQVLLEAVRRLPPGSVTVEVWGEPAPYHGDASHLPALRRLLQQPGVTHHGPSSRTEIAAGLARLDALVVPSIWIENAPLVVAEAFLSGLPVVASDHGGLAEAVRHEVNGLRFRVGDAEDLRRTLLRLLEEPELLSRLRAGIPAVKTIAEHAEELRALYGEALTRASTAPMLAAVVVNYRTPSLTIEAVRRLQAGQRPADLVVVVDNGGADADSLASALPEAQVLATEQNLGFAAGSNRGLEAALQAGAARVLFLNSDARLEPAALAELDAALDLPGAGIAGPSLIGSDGLVESEGLTFSERSGRMRLERSGGPPSQGPPRDVPGVSGCALLLRREVIDVVGRFSAETFFGFEDLELCLRAGDQGFRVLHVPGAHVVHPGGGSLDASSPLRLYYASRNHLRLAARRPGHSTRRQGAILGFNLALALLRGERRAARTAAVLRGAWDHARGRYGQG